MKENAEVLEALSSYLSDRRANMRDVRKGFLFYIELEKKEIRKAKASHRARKLLGKAEG